MSPLHRFTQINIVYRTEINGFEVTHLLYVESYNLFALLKSTLYVCCKWGHICLTISVEEP